MPNGISDPYNLENIGFEQISGAGGADGGQNLTDLINSLYGTLRTAGYFGTEAEGKSLGEIGYGQFESPDMFSMTGQGEYNIENIMGQKDLFSDIPGTTTSDEKKGMQSLFSLLEKLNIPEMQKGYGQDVGDVKSEIGAQMQGLLQGVGVGGKGSRYGGLGTRGKNITGGRGQYLSDYYGLQEKQFEMQKDLQAGLEDEFSTGVGQWMQLQPA